MRRPGFTLIELLIVTAVFSIVALVATTIITRVQSTQREILGRQRVVGDGRYILETLARTVRQNFLNYDYYAANSGANPQTVLATKDQSNVETCYLVSNSKIQIISGSNVTNCTGATPADITPADLNVVDFHIYISPRSDPFKPAPRQASDCYPLTGNYDTNRGVCACTAGTALTACFLDQTCQSTVNVGLNCGATENISTCQCQNANQQPQVTIVLATQTKNQAAGESAASTLQTTVTSHLYRR